MQERDHVEFQELNPNGTVTTIRYDKTTGQEIGSTRAINPDIIEKINKACERNRRTKPKSVTSRLGHLAHSIFNFSEKAE